MMAQRSQAMIDAVEIDEAAALQAGRNFKNSRWVERLKVYHEPVQEFATKNSHAYDGIISNPPYFHNQLGSADVAARQARHTVELSYSDLCRCASELLTENGLFWVILPALERMIFLSTALQYGLYGKKMLSIFDQADKKPVRIILCLCKSIIMEATWDELIIKGTEEAYTTEYIALTKNFYL
jgi:tRNA1Val (adenine37-N6)-methyltransferase